MPKLPKKVKGVAAMFNVVYRKHKTRAGRLHMYRKGGARIEINPDMPKDVQLATFVHECFHLADKDTGGDLKESVIDRLSLGWIALCKRNKWTLPGQ